jgi:hypothetical protein
MRLMIESTGEIALFEGVECRVWNGTTELGLPVSVLVPLMMVPRGSPVANHLTMVGQKFREAGK